MPAKSGAGEKTAGRKRRLHQRETAASERNSRGREKWPRQRLVAGYPGSRGCQRAPENADRWKAEEKCTGISTIEKMR